jgi:hypothetical protein
MIDKVEKQKRIYQIGLMLRRKPVSFIIEFMIKEWGIEKAQAYRYIASAREEWQKYFSHLKGSGMSYHVANLRDLRDQAYNKKVIIGKGDNKETVTIADLGLVFEISKEEAKLMGVYPGEKHELIVEEKEKVKEKYIDDVLMKLTESELKKLIAIFESRSEKEITRVLESVTDTNKQKLIKKGETKNVF